MTEQLNMSCFQRGERKTNYILRNSNIVPHSENCDNEGCHFKACLTVPVLKSLENDFFFVKLADIVTFLNNYPRWKHWKFESHLQGIGENSVYVTCCFIKCGNHVW